MGSDPGPVCQPVADGSHRSPAPGEWIALRWGGETAVQAARSLRAGAMVLLYGAIGHPAVATAARSAPLTPAERARAARYLFAANRDEFVAGRAMVRHVLGPFFGVAPGALGFDAAAFHKPRVTGPGSDPVDVSLSHADGWVACALAVGCLVGVDVEPDRVLAADDRDGMARQVFAPGERAALAIAEAQADAGASLFFEIWRRKEAVLKAAGLGFSGDPAALCLARPDTRTGVTWQSTVVFAGRRWQVASVTPPGAPPMALAWSPNDPPRSRPGAA